MESIDKTAKEINKMTKEIERAKVQLNQNQGREKELMKQLKETHGFDNVNDAQKSLEEILKNIDDLSRQINQKYCNLSEALDA